MPEQDSFAFVWANLKTISMVVGWIISLVVAIVVQRGKQKQLEKELKSFKESVKESMDKLDDRHSELATEARALDRVVVRLGSDVENLNSYTNQTLGNINDTLKTITTKVLAG